MEYKTQWLLQSSLIPLELESGTLLNIIPKDGASLDELENYRGKFGLGIERDLYFEPNLTESKFAIPAKIPTYQVQRRSENDRGENMTART